MKKFLSKISVTAALAAALLTTGAPMAYAAEFPDTAIPAVTLNRELTTIRTKMINNTLYFSLRDYWVQAKEISPEKIKWYAESNAVSNGYGFLFLDSQTYRNEIGKTISLTDPALLIDGTTYVAASFIDDSRLNNRDTSPAYEEVDGILNLKITTWKHPNGENLDYRLPVLHLDSETELPEFEEVPGIKANFTNDDFVITKTETDFGKTILTYASKEDPAKTATVTVIDDYVSLVQDPDRLFEYLFAA